MNSPKYLNYETRPLKFTERKMLLGTFQRVCNLYQDDYQYIGLGGLSFTDFKLFHKELHINEMFDIEGGFNIEKVSFNSPYSFIKIIPELSTVALTKIDLQKKSLIWLDYDGTLETYMFEDVSILMSKLPVGSIYIFTCNRELKSKGTGDLYEVEEFKDIFGEMAPFGISDKDFSGAKDYITIRTMILNLIEKIISDRNRLGENLRFHQLYNILYQENRGAKMFTFGGVITEKETPVESLNLSSFNFVSHDSTTYKIDIPNLTLKESDLINNHIANEDEVANLKKMKIVTDSEIIKYKATYKYVPTFFDVRI